MKQDKLNEMKKIDLKALLVEVDKLKKELSELQIKKNSGKVTNLKEFKLKRKDLAQILTVIRQKQLLEKLENKGEKNG